MLYSLLKAFPYSRTSYGTLSLVDRIYLLDGGIAKGPLVQ